MKLSKKVLLVTVGLIIAGGIVGLMFMRNHTLQWLRKTEAESGFKTMAVGAFESLDFSDHWSVDIRQGNEYKVQVAVNDQPVLRPQLENIGGTLYFKTDTAAVGSAIIRAKVEVPSLQAIRAVRSTKIHLRDFQSDSIFLNLENGCVFTGSNNRFGYMKFKTAGDVSLQLTDGGAMN
jgi:hypothetical protein